MMSLPFLAAKLPLGSSIAVNYNEQSKIWQVTISKSSQQGIAYVRLETQAKRQTEGREHHYMSHHEY